jgi:hypothetical protein
MTHAHAFRLAGLALLLGAAGALADKPNPGNKPVLDKTTTGTPNVKSIDVIRFGPGGVLFIGDGRGGQVLAVAVGGKEAKAGFKESISGIDKKLAGKLGGESIDIVDLAVNPVTHIAFVAVRHQGKPVILTIDGDGKIDEFTLEGAKYAQVALPAEDKAPITRVTDVAWAGDRLLVAGLANEKFASKIFTVPGPLSHEAKASVYSTETFHVAHNRWETNAPMTVLMPYEEDGKKYVAGSFACTPVVKYPLEDLKPGDKVKGVSMIEMGNGNRPMNMFSYEKGGKNYVLMNTQRMQRFHDTKPVGPSPYWTVCFDRELLVGREKINEKALWRVDRDLNPKTDRIRVVEDFHGVMHMDRLDAGRALTLKKDKDGMTLAPLALP